MVRRAKKIKPRRKSPKTVSLWNLGVGYIYLDSFMRMSTGYGPAQFILGEGDLKIGSLADVQSYTGGL